MRIDDWPTERIMQLPDWCFGTQYPVCVTVKANDGVTRWDISEVAFPDVGVIWELSIWPAYWTFAVDYIRLALGNQLPVAVAEMNTLEPLIPGLGDQRAEPRWINATFTMGAMRVRMRKPVPFQGRKLVVEGTATALKYVWVHVVVVVSSMPKEVPGWLRW